jgi:leader peptidase (prepilin peptidase)/N-methyltransferase
VQVVPVAAIIGFLLGCASWVAAMKLTAGTRGGGQEDRSLLLLSGASGGGVLTVAALRSAGDPFQISVVAILAIPLLITLLTDVLARLVFPSVLIPGLLTALTIAAARPSGLPAALISGGGAAGVTAVLVVLSRRIWSGREEPPLGSGDILIAATIGSMLGPDETPRVLFAGVMLGAVAAGLLLLTRHARGEDVIPYGAFLCGAALVALAF